MPVGLIVAVHALTSIALAGNIDVSARAYAQSKLANVLFTFALNAAPQSTLVVNASGECIAALVAVFEHRASQAAKSKRAEKLADWEYMVWDNGTQCTVGMFAAPGV